MIDRPDWTVWRQDDNGNRFVVKSGLTEQQARQLTSELESHGHKQLYWMTRVSAVDEKASVTEVVRLQPTTQKAV